MLGSMMLLSPLPPTRVSESPGSINWLSYSPLNSFSSQGSNTTVGGHVDNGAKRRKVDKGGSECLIPGCSTKSLNGVWVCGRHGGKAVCIRPGCTSIVWKDNQCMKCLNTKPAPTDSEQAEWLLAQPAKRQQRIRETVGDRLYENLLADITKIEQDNDEVRGLALVETRKEVSRARENIARSKLLRDDEQKQKEKRKAEEKTARMEEKLAEKWEKWRWQVSRCKECREGSASGHCVIDGRAYFEDPSRLSILVHLEELEVEKPGSTFSMLGISSDPSSWLVDTLGGFNAAVDTEYAFRVGSQELRQGGLVTSTGEVWQWSEPMESRPGELKGLQRDMLDLFTGPAGISAFFVHTGSGKGVMQSAKYIDSTLLLGHDIKVLTLNFLKLLRALIGKDRFYPGFALTTVFYSVAMHQVENEIDILRLVSMSHSAGADAFMTYYYCVSVLVTLEKRLNGGVSKNEDKIPKLDIEVGDVRH